MYFWIFRGGFGEASVSKASPKRKKSINQLSKNGSTIDKGKKNMFGDMLKKTSEFAEQLRKVDVVKEKIENTLMYRYKTMEKIIEVEIQSVGSQIIVKLTDDVMDIITE